MLTIGAKIFEAEKSLLITSCKVMHIFGQTTLTKAECSKFICLLFVSKSVFIKLICIEIRY